MTKKGDTVEWIVKIKLTKHSWDLIWLWCDNVIWCYSEDNFNDKLKNIILQMWEISQI